MANNVAFFAIHADDLPRAMAFYGNVFGWKFEPWGPPGFYLIDTGPDGIRGALQGRRIPIDGKAIIGYECTIAVESIDETIRRINENGGTIVIPKVTIPTVGDMCQFNDTEGNLAGAMQYIRSEVPGDQRRTK